jgi:hypothetical protein
MKSHVDEDFKLLKPSSVMKIGTEKTIDSPMGVDTPRSRSWWPGAAGRRGAFETFEQRFVGDF